VEGTAEVGKGRKMKRSFTVFALALALAALVPGAAAAYLLSDELLAFIASVPPTRDLAAGEGKFSRGQPAQQFNVAAHGGPLDATGNVRFNSEGFAEVKGTVDCLFVTGNRAGVAGVLAQGIGPSGAFRFFVLALEDNGEPGGAVPDRATFEVSTAHTSAADCGLADAIGLGSTPIVQGNIVVMDR
jgi:hypothetical protein